MSLVFTQDEQVIKNWNYGTEKVKKSGFWSFLRKTEKTDVNLTVTNKRIISEKSTQYSVKREEIKVDQVKGVSTSYTHRPRNKLAGILALVAGVLFMILLLVSQSVDEPAVETLFTVVSLMSLLVAIVFLCIFLKSIKKYFKLNIYSDIFTCSAIDLIAGKAPITSSFGLFKKITPVLSIDVNIEVAKEIVDTIGSLTVAK